jgi:hypothetical protein
MLLDEVCGIVKALHIYQQAGIGDQKALEATEDGAIDDVGIPEVIGVDDDFIG